jgi:hypothetical protein
VQQTQSDVAHQELLDALKAQDEILQDLADTPPPSETPPPAPAQEDDVLTDAQRKAVEAQYGDRSIEEVREVGRPGRRNRPRLVRLVDGTLLTVYIDGRGRVGVREVDSRHGRPRSARDRRPPDPEST